MEQSQRLDISTPCGNSPNVLRLHLSGVTSGLPFRQGVSILTDTSLLILITLIAIVGFLMA